MVELPAGFSDPVLIGRGAMAEVYRVRQHALDRHVALKRIRGPAPEDDHARARFAREIGVLARLAHPHIVRLIDGGIAGGQPYLITELIDGTDLEALLDGRPAPELLPVVADVLAGLAYLHAEGVIHRDVKPANVLVPHVGPARVADFGLARGADSSLITAAGVVPGTPMYLSPECLLGAPATPASDLYAVGVMLHRILTGAYPAGLSCDADAFLGQRIGMDARPVQLAFPRVSGALGALTDRLLARLPEARPASADAARAALVAALEPPRVRRPRRASWAGPLSAALALGMTAAAFMAARPGAPLAAPALARAPLDPTLDPTAVAFERDAAGVALSFQTARPARAQVRFRSGHQSWGRIAEERAAVAHRVLVEDAPLDLDLELELGFEDERGTFPYRLASPLSALERACAGLDRVRLEALGRELAAALPEPEVRAAMIERELVRSGYRAVLPLAISLRGPLLHGAPAAGAPAMMRRAALLSRLGLLRRLDRLAVGLPFTSGVEALLAPEFAPAPDARLTSASVPLAVPADTWLEQSGLHTRELTDPGWRRAAAFALAAPVHGGTAELVVEVADLAPEACVIATLLPAGLEIELWRPAGGSGPVRLAHTFDAAFLTGRDRVLLAMGLVDAGFQPDRLVALQVADRAETVRRGLGCVVRRAGVNLPR